MWKVCQTEKCRLPENVEVLGWNVWEKRKNFFCPCSRAGGRPKTAARCGSAWAVETGGGFGAVRAGTVSRAALGMGYAARWWSRVVWVRGGGPSRALRGVCAGGLALARRVCPRAVETRGGSMRWRRAVLGGERATWWTTAGDGARDLSRKTGRRASGVWDSGPSSRP